MAKFDLKGLLNDRSVPDRQQDQKIVYRNPEDLIPSEENFYNTEKLERLKQSIKLLGILQPLLIENRDGKDYVIAGHCRRKCCIDLLNEGNDRFSRVPCIYKTQSELEQDAGQENDIVRQIMIIQANCYRDKSDWEKMTETLKMEGLVKELREKSPMEGKTRDILKDLIGTSGGQLGRYHAINTNLCEQLMSEFEEDRIKISVAYEASKLNREYQKQACELYEETGILTLDDIRDLYRQQEAEKGIPGQMSIETATGQNRPPENEVPITPELQIERFFEALNRGDKEYVLTCNVSATTYLLETRYRDVRIRNGNFNYQANSTGIMFNPGSYMECTFTWNEMAHELIKRFGKKRKPVKMVSIDAPEKPKKKDNEMPGPAKCITGKSKSGICGAAAYCDTEYKCCAQCPDDCNSRCGWLEERCQPAAETPDEKQHDFVEDTKIADHPGEVTALPIMKNNDQRKEWLRNYKVWGLWYEDKNIGVKYYKYDFKNGARLIVEEYEPDPRNQNSWWVSNLTESHYMHLVGGPEPEHKNNIPKWTYHTRYNKFPNSESELVEFLKELQK
ncbi:ParB/RepB/Spo0J family partition protein [Blautia massiliensis (ex Durand et al. 2017)]|uniref:ParB/RepB/Spo0J family partition protein n=1 Tax=Blautia massiliensis (ex Durand et al. 2017) TaxID=1737424 RepID=UPI0022DEB501|nr:ParB/RepB/Spo0J family partition protein [Blautia massiliensis (ex Durand et al. 2017)]